MPGRVRHPVADLDEPTFVFVFRVTHSVELTAGQVWPDGNGPVEPTVGDVRRAVERLGGAQAVLRGRLLDRESLNEAVPADEGRSAFVSAVELGIASGKLDCLPSEDARDQVRTWSDGRFRRKSP